MNPSTTSAVSEALTEAQRNALLKLLVDEDPAIHRTVREKILSYGSDSVRQWLQPHALSSDPALRRRTREILDFLDRQDADNRFLSFCLSQGEDLDIETAAWLLAQTRYPEVNPKGYSALLDMFAGELKERIDFGAGGEEILDSINQYLFGELGFHGNEEEYYDPENSYLNRVLDRRTGNPISLSTIYILLARRLQLPVAGIGMPDHFVARFQTPTNEVFIDVFNKGRLLSKADCVNYLQNSSHGFQEGYLAPASSKRMLLRMCYNLHQISQRQRSAEELARFQRYIVALAK